MPSAYELAQLNIANLAAPLDTPRLSDFVDNLERINALAEQSPGFVWRLQTDDGDATSIRPFGASYIVNLSVWKDIGFSACLCLSFSPRQVAVAAERVVSALGGSIIGLMVGADRTFTNGCRSSAEIASAANQRGVATGVHVQKTIRCAARLKSLAPALTR